MPAQDITLLPRLIWTLIAPLCDKKLIMFIPDCLACGTVLSRNRYSDGSRGASGGSLDPQPRPHF